MKEKKILFQSRIAVISSIDFKWNQILFFSITYTKRLTCSNASYILILLL